ncbi:MAG: hypothetical protein EBU82_06215 [Flavobacteriia bacterium]|nr:hypothetical protein [Flavobacteriia bacterium]
MADDQVNQEVIQGELSAPLLTATEPVLPVNPPAPIPLPEEEEEEEQEEEEEFEEEEEEEVPPTIYEQSAQYLQYFGIQSVFFLFKLINWLTIAAETTQTITKGVVRSLQSKTYVFFKDNNYPYRLQDYKTSGPGVAPVEWYYDADKKLFLAFNLHNTSTHSISRHFDWLSGEIKYNGLVLYDISDFLEDAKWAGVAQPAPARILAAWSLHSGVVLQFREGLSLHTINKDGTESVLQLCG